MIPILIPAYRSELSSPSAPFSDLPLHSINLLATSLSYHLPTTSSPLSSFCTVVFFSVVLSTLCTITCLNHKKLRALADSIATLPLNAIAPSFFLTKYNDTNPTRAPHGQKPEDKVGGVDNEKDLVANQIKVKEEDESRHKSKVERGLPLSPVTWDACEDPPCKLKDNHYYHTLQPGFPLAWHPYPQPHAGLMGPKAAIDKDAPVEKQKKKPVKQAVSSKRPPRTAENNFYDVLSSARASYQRTPVARAEQNCTSYSFDDVLVIVTLVASINSFIRTLQRAVPHTGEAIDSILSACLGGWDAAFVHSPVLPALVLLLRVITLSTFVLSRNSFTLGTFALFFVVSTLLAIDAALQFSNLRCPPYTPESFHLAEECCTALRAIVAQREQEALARRSLGKLVIKFALALVIKCGSTVLHALGVTSSITLRLLKRVAVAALQEGLQAASDGTAGYICMAITALKASAVVVGYIIRAVVVLKMFSGDISTAVFSLLKVILRAVYRHTPSTSDHVGKFKAPQQIFVKGLNGLISTINVTACTTITTIKDEIQRKTSVPREEQGLSYGLHEFQNNCQLTNYDVPSLATVHLSARLWGGARPPKREQSLSSCAGSQGAHHRAECKLWDAIEAVAQKQSEEHSDYGEVPRARRGKRQKRTAAARSSRAGVKPSTSTSPRPDKRRDNAPPAHLGKLASSPKHATKNVWAALHAQRRSRIVKLSESEKDALWPASLPRPKPTTAKKRRSSEQGQTAHETTGRPAKSAERPRAAPHPGTKGAQPVKAKDLPQTGTKKAREAAASTTPKQQEQPQEKLPKPKASKPADSKLAAPQTGKTRKRTASKPAIGRGAGPTASSASFPLLAKPALASLSEAFDGDEGRWQHGRADSRKEIRGLPRKQQEELLVMLHLAAKQLGDRRALREAIELPARSKAFDYVRLPPQPEALDKGLEGEGGVNKVQETVTAKKGVYVPCTTAALAASVYARTSHYEAGSMSGASVAGPDGEAFGVIDEGDEPEFEPSEEEKKALGLAPKHVLVRERQAALVNVWSMPQLVEELTQPSTWLELPVLAPLAFVLDSSIFIYRVDPSGWAYDELDHCHTRSYHFPSDRPSLSEAQRTVLLPLRSTVSQSNSGPLTLFWNGTHFVADVRSLASSAAADFTLDSAHPFHPDKTLPAYASSTPLRPLSLGLTHPSVLYGILRKDGIVADGVLAAGAVSQTARGMGAAGQPLSTLDSFGAVPSDLGNYNAAGFAVHHLTLTMRTRRRDFESASVARCLTPLSKYPHRPDVDDPPSSPYLRLRRLYNLALAADHKGAASSILSPAKLQSWRWLAKRANLEESNDVDTLWRKLSAVERDMTATGFGVQAKQVAVKGRKARAVPPALKAKGGKMGGKSESAKQQPTLVSASAQVKGSTVSSSTDNAQGPSSTTAACLPEGYRQLMIRKQRERADPGTKMFFLTLNAEARRYAVYSEAVSPGMLTAKSPLDISAVLSALGRKWRKRDIERLVPPTLRNALPQGVYTNATNLFLAAIDGTEKRWLSFPPLSSSSALPDLLEFARHAGYVSSSSVTLDGTAAAALGRRQQLSAARKGASNRR
ncbi:hypothetical protein JCM10213_008411 [Rhodosporidiobolus nylandii]